MRVTIGIPFHNNEDTLADAIRSVFAQDYQDWELILIDDGSTDGSAAIASSVDDPRVTLISDGKNLGLPARLNMIIKAAKGEYIARMDADDIMHPQRIGLQVKYLDANPDVDVVSTPMWTIDSSNNVIGLRDRNPIDSHPNAALKPGLMPHATIMARTQWCRSNLYDESFFRAQDYELWCRTSEHSTFSKMEEPLYFCKETYRSPSSYLKTYLRSGRINRRILKMYGPDRIGKLKTSIRIAASYIKCGIYYTATVLGAQKLLIGSRAVPLSDAEFTLGSKALKNALCTQVPGLDTTSANAPLTDAALPTAGKLVHVTTVPYQLNYFAGQINFMRENGLDVSVITSPGDLPSGFNDTVRIYRTSITRAISPIKDILSILRIAKLLRQIKPDIVHSHTPKGGLIGTLAARLAGVPVRIYHIHGLPITTASGWKRTVLHICDWVTCRFAKKILCVSDSVRSIALNEGICNDEKIDVLACGSINGIDADNQFNPDKQRMHRSEIRNRFGIPENATVIGFIGRIIREKGIEELTQAWLKLREDFPDPWLMIVGPFEPQDPISEDARRVLQTDPRVVLTGLQWDTSSFYSAMDIFTLPTYREGFPVVLLEAAAMGLPIVTTEVSGCVDAVINNQTGILVPAMEAASLEEALRAYLLNPQLCEQHGSEGRERVIRDYRREDIWKATHAEYVRLMDEQKPLQTGHKPIWTSQS